MIRLILTIMFSALASVSMGGNDCGTSYQADINYNATGLFKPPATQSLEVGFTYDALGRRLSKTFGTTVTRWVWNGNVPLHQWRQRREYSVMEGGWKTSPERRDMTLWLFDEESFVPAAMLRDGRSYSILTDQLGTPTEAYDNEGNEVWSRVLDMDGNVIEETGNVGMIPFLFQGQYYDRETGLAYNRFRYYDPKTGAYISQDPIGLAGGILNLYGYVDDTNAWIDALGLKSYNSQNLKVGDELAPNTTVKRIRKGTNGKMIVIGRSMDSRIIPAAKNINAEHWTGFDPQLSSEVNVSNNRRWIEEKISDGYTVIDVGLDPMYKTGSGNMSLRKGPYYGVETEVAFGTRPVKI